MVYLLQGRRGPPPPACLREGIHGVGAHGGLYPVLYPVLYRPSAVPTVGGYSTGPVL